MLFWLKEMLRRWLGKPKPITYYDNNGKRHYFKGGLKID